MTKEFEFAHDADNDSALSEAMTDPFVSAKRRDPRGCGSVRPLHHGGWHARVSRLGRTVLAMLIAISVSGCGDDGAEAEDVTAAQCAAWGGTMTEDGCVKNLTEQECEAIGSTYRDGECISSEEYYGSD
ncbi:MAG: hypothetical protein AAGE01_14185 [Pseudomonadota bacterium]